MRRPLRRAEPPGTQLRRLRFLRLLLHLLTVRIHADSALYQPDTAFFVDKTGKKCAVWHSVTLLPSQWP